MALQRPQPANGRIARCKIHTVRSQSPVSQLPNHRAHPPVVTPKQNSRQKRRHESISILGESPNLMMGSRESGVGSRESGVGGRESSVGESGMMGSRESGVGSRPWGNLELLTMMGSRESGVGSRESGDLSDRAIDKIAVGKRHCRLLNALSSQNIPCRPYL